MADDVAQSCADSPRLTIVLGRCRLDRRDARDLSPGQLVSLEEQADWPVEVYCDGKAIGRGELLHLDGKFCVRMSELSDDGYISRAA